MTDDVVQQDLVSELENERTNRVIAQQTANQERLQARASAAESASLRRQLNELNQQMEQEKRAAAAARLQAQQTESSQVSLLLFASGVSKTSCTLARLAPVLSHAACWCGDQSVICCHICHAMLKRWHVLFATMLHFTVKQCGLIGNVLGV